jgi:hypothetical protein
MPNPSKYRLDLIQERARAKYPKEINQDVDKCIRKIFTEVIKDPRKGFDNGEEMLIHQCNQLRK